MRLLTLLAVLPFLTACQSCRNPPVPAPKPAPGPEPYEAGAPPVDDAGAAPKDAASEAEAPEAGLPEAGPAVPANPCWGGILGPAHAFCEQEVPTMVSVKPESVDAKGKLYHAMSASTARTRLIVRHANVSRTSKLKVVVFIENAGRSSGRFILLKKGVAGPTMDFQEGESLAVDRWSTSTPKAAVQVAAGKSVKLDASVEVGLQVGYATMGLYEYSFDQAHAVHVCVVGDREDASVCPGL